MPERAEPSTSTSGPVERPEDGLNLLSEALRYRVALRQIVNGVSLTEAELKEIAQEALDG